SRRRHTSCSRDWSSDVCSSDLAFNASRITLKPSLIASMTVRISGHAVFWNHDTTGAITLFLTKPHAALIASRHVSNPSFISARTISMTGHTHVWNQDTTGSMTAMIPSHTAFIAPHSACAPLEIASHTPEMPGARD